MTESERVLTSALFTILNVEGAATHGPIEGLDVAYHFSKVREALRHIQSQYPHADILMESDAAASTRARIRHNIAARRWESGG